MLSLRKKKTYRSWKETSQGTCERKSDLADYLNAKDISVDLEKQISGSRPLLAERRMGNK